MPFADRLVALFGSSAQRAEDESHRPRAERVPRRDGLKSTTLSFLHRQLVQAVLASALALCALGCGPMIEREGRRVFNPAWSMLLDQSSREDWQKPEQVLDALLLPPDAVVADIGAGSGYFTERLALRLRVGRVYATDAQPEMIERLERRVRMQALDNVTVVQAAFDDPGLPHACCDLVFLSSVYKEIADRVAYMRRVRPLLRPGGRVAILEFLPDARGVGPPVAVRLAPERIRAELEAADYELVERFDFLPREAFLVFRPSGPRCTSQPPAAGSPSSG